ncbi:SDR family oxidoreductase [uncultured Desulfosarcina sp.]|uniref:SDR family oxidoreductase n=1 Tax=uncultured Desulfosarcina sp. TaxID=218289 RepID=UPI0029C7814A|nr:SDR family oxidoreductase [uncultured Desulfosarcina sp.]
MSELKNKIAVVTGASSGIGKAIALGLAKKGVATFLLGRNLKALQQVAEIARQTSARSQFFAVDLASVQEIRKIADSLKKEAACIDILIHSAGIIAFGPHESASLEDFDRQFQINVRAPYALTQCLLPLVKDCRGQVVFINSSAGLNAGAKVGQYAATKFALKAIADSFRLEINSDGVRVLSVYPGRTASPMQAAIFKMEGREYHPELLMQPEDVADVILNALTIPRSAEVTEISVRPFIKP